MIARPRLHLEHNSPPGSSRCLSQRPSPLHTLNLLADSWLQETAISATMALFFSVTLQIKNVRLSVDM